MSELHTWRARHHGSARPTFTHHTSVWLNEHPQLIQLLFDTERCLFFLSFGQATSHEGRSWQILQKTTPHSRRTPIQTHCAEVAFCSESSVNQETSSLYIGACTSKEFLTLLLNFFIKSATLCLSITISLVVMKMVERYSGKKQTPQHKQAMTFPYVSCWQSLYDWY